MRIATPQTMNLQTRESTSSSMRSLMLPNVPVQPTNGMIRTYENQSRTFTRPYSAKTVFFYKEGDEYFSGIRVPVSKQRYRTIDSLLDDLNRNIQMPFGVRRLTTPMGRTPIETVDQLEHLGKYVASSSKYSRGINLSALERLKKARMLAEENLRKERSGGQSFWIPTSPSYKAKLRLSRTLGFNVMPSKQIFFVLNGKMDIYRTLLNPLRLPTMEQLLAEVSDGLQVAIFRFYTTDGLRILNVSDMISINPPKIYACTRNEKLNLRHDLELPSINNGKYYNRYKSGTETSSSGGNNGIEKPRRFESALRRNTRKRTGAPVRRFPRTLPSINASQIDHRSIAQKRASSIPDETDSGKANSISSRQTDNSRTEDEDIYAAGSSVVPLKVRKPATRVGGLSRIPNPIDKRKQINPPQNTASTVSTSTNKAIAAATSGVAAVVAISKSSESKLEEEEEREDIINEGIEDGSGDEDVKEVMETDEKENENHIATNTKDDGNDTDQSEELNTTDKAEMIRQESQLSQATDIEQDLVMTDDSRPSSSTNKPHDILEEDLIKDEEDDEITLKPSNEKMDLAENDKKSYEEAEDNEEMTTIEEESEVITEKLVEAEATDNTGVEAQEEGEIDAKETTQEPEEDKSLGDRQNQAATAIQAAFRGYNTRKLLKPISKNADVVNEIEMHDDLPALVDDEPADMKDQELDEEQTNKTPPDSAQKKSMYTIQINTGNRWGSETEADLHIMLYGDDGTSSKLSLQHENIPWLQASDPRFQRNQNDFFHLDTPSVGTINKIVLGHEQKGYGAGIFIGYVIVTENLLEGRQFFFSVNKWFDSGQVDGKIERPIPVAAFYYVNSIPDESVVSQGRWEFVLHNGNKSGQGGTTSDILIYGYGMEGSSVTRVENDITLQNIPSTTLVQVDFGAIGDLIKVRFEIIPVGEQPNYFLEYVELRDLDTEERLVVRVGKWLEVTSEKKNPQAFREIGVYRAGVEGLHVINYEGRVHVGDMNLLENNDLSGQLIGTFDSAVFPLTYNENKKEYVFKVECVDLGRVSKLKIIGNFSKEGEAIMEGLSVLQDIWDCYAPGISVADQVLATHAYVRESSHCPYRYVLSQGKVVELDDTKPYFKTLDLTAMEGLSTMYKKDRVPAGVGLWTLDVSVEGKVNKTPDIWLVSGHKAHLMKLVKEGPNELTLQVKSKDLKIVDKVRIFAGQLESDQELAIRKLRLSNSLTGQVVRFPNIDTEFGSNDIYEFSTVYPDVSPKPNITFEIVVNTTKSTGSFLPVFNLYGETSNSGVRQWDPKRNMETGLETFEIDAVNLGELTELEIIILGDKKSQWYFKEILIKNAETMKTYRTSEGTISKEGEGKRFQLHQVLSN